MRKPDLLQRLRAKKQEKERALAVAWYDELNWAMVKSTAIDPHRFENSYAEWHAMATRTLENFKRAGAVPTPVPVTARELIAWCRATGRQNDASARAAYALMLARARERRQPQSAD